MNCRAAARATHAVISIITTVTAGVSMAREANSGDVLGDVLGGEDGTAAVGVRKLPPIENSPSMQDHQAGMPELPGIIPSEQHTGGKEQKGEQQMEATAMTGVSAAAADDLDDDFDEMLSVAQVRVCLQ